MGCRSRLATIIICMAPVSVSYATEFTQTVFFGDSLTDSGTYLALGVVPPGTGKFTTNPGPVWSENLATYFGTTAIPAVAGGTNYAIGGARIMLLPGNPAVPPTVNATPVATQITEYLTSKNGIASPKNLYTVWGGANDILVSSGFADPASYVIQTAGQEVQLIGILQTAGAKYIIVPTIPDIGDTPLGLSLGPVGAAELTELTTLYNFALFEGLANNDSNVIPIDTFDLLREVIADPRTYGFVNVTSPACGATPSLLCTAADFVTPDANETFLFADDVHPTTAGHRILSDYTISVILAPHQISMLPESEVKVRISHLDQINIQLEEAAWLRAKMCQHYWVTLSSQHIEFDANRGFLSTAGTNYNVTVGADFGLSPQLLFGGAIAYGHITPHWGEDRGKYRQEDLIFSAYSAWRNDDWYLNGVASYGNIDFETHRTVPLGSVAVREAKGNPDGRNWSLSLLGGYDFYVHGISHGPQIGWLYQNILVKSFSEDGGSIALAFHNQHRTSNISSAGWYATYRLPLFVLYAQVLLDHEFQHGARTIAAQVVEISEVGWDSLAFKAGRTWVPATIGFTGHIGKSIAWNLAVQHTFAQRSAEVTSVFVSTSIDI